MTSHDSATSSAEPEEDSATADGSSDDGDPVELLVKGREKRATAGTRMSMLLEKEGDDELELLFAEDEQEEDNEFEAEDAEDASDVQLDSASDDDDQGPTKDDNDLEGEEELQRQARVERQKKRKAQDNLLKPGGLKKRARPGPQPGTVGSAATPKTPAPRPKKKSERVSWLPIAHEGSVRASARKATVQNKEEITSRLVASEKRRIEQLHVMTEAAKRREAGKPKAMTQVQRMEEAARIERSNAKSLNRWEESEKKRVKEQKARLEAMHNRQLTGPVLSWWSGMGKWINDKLNLVGWQNIKAAQLQDTQALRHEEDTAQVTPSTNEHEPVIIGGESRHASQHQSFQQSWPMREGDTNTNSPATEPPPQESQGFLHGIYDYANLPESSSGNVLRDHDPFTDHGKDPPEPSTPPPAALEPLATGIQRDPVPPQHPAVEFSSRNLVILNDIDPNGQRPWELQNQVLLKKRNGKLQKAVRELCAITEQPARYRDPKTGLAYADSYAYKEIQKLANGGSRWSSLLGCYVGPTSSVARGVPDRFWKIA
ncbi:MAG: hypothetical protein LQ350_002191 [Teloschistes chrysophthalmus]|nr:MAG: hypothetical protein LQ350_002191 [Niorma chrysophthalma]